MKINLYLMLFLSLLSSYAFSGQDRGGGDFCENRITVIRSDIRSWILGDGPQGLKLPEGMTIARYSNEMLTAIDKSIFRCVGPGDDGYPVSIDETAKVCVFDRSLNLVTCDIEKFMKASENEQYVLVHHELAGLGDLEPPQGPTSNYVISDQISAFLEEQVVKKLAVKKQIVDVGPKENIVLKKGMKVVYDDPNSNKGTINFDGIIKTVFERSVEICLNQDCYITQKNDVFVSDPSIRVSVLDGRTFKVGDILTDGKEKAAVSALAVIPETVGSRSCETLFCSKGPLSRRFRAILNGKAFWNYITRFEKAE